MEKLDSIETRETTIPPDHDVGLSEAVPCHPLMDPEVRML